jgi:hypothetical protein
MKESCCVSQWMNRQTCFFGTDSLGAVSVEGYRGRTCSILWHDGEKNTLSDYKGEKGPNPVRVRFYASAKATNELRECTSRRRVVQRAEESELGTKLRQ